MESVYIGAIIYIISPIHNLTETMAWYALANEHGGQVLCSDPPVTVAAFPLFLFFEITPNFSCYYIKFGVISENQKGDERGTVLYPIRAEHRCRTLPSQPFHRPPAPFSPPPTSHSRCMTACHFTIVLPRLLLTPDFG